MNGEVPELRAADIDAFANRLRSKGGSIAIFGAHQFFKKRGYQTGGLYQAIRNLAVLQQHRFSKIGQNIVLIEVGADFLLNADPTQATLSQHSALLHTAGCCSRPAKPFTEQQQPACHRRCSTSLVVPVLPSEMRQ
jgi:hypothetical protein